MPSSPAARLQSLAELTKPRISATVTLSAVSVYLLASGGEARTLASLAAGVFLLAAGACAINEFQEREADARMPRTRNRPLPSGRITPLGGLAAGVAAAAGGAAMLYFGVHGLTACLGVCGMLCYNGVYTPLKYRSAFAAVPGALVGAVGPALGWAAAGRPLGDIRLAAVCFFFFMWQVPHFWLLARRYAEEYEGAGFPTVTAVLRPDQLARVIFTWTLATAASLLLLPLYGVVASAPVIILLPLAAALLFLSAARTLWAGTGAAALRSAFMNVNLFLLLVMTLLALDPRL